MSYTKGQLVYAAFEEIGIASYEFDISPDQLSSAMRRLDSMMAEWASRGIMLSYPINKEEDITEDQDSNIPDWAWEAVITNLAIRLAPSYGKTPSPDTKNTARKAYSSMVGIFARPQEMQLNSMPKGAGYKATDTRFTDTPESKVLEPIDEEFDPSGGLE